MTKSNNDRNSASGRGGYRENAGRKSSWNHKDTCTIRIPKLFADQLVELARCLDNGEIIDFDTESKQGKYDLVTESIAVDADSLTELTHQQRPGEKIDTGTKSNSPNYDTVTKSISLPEHLVTELAHQQQPGDKIDTETKSKLLVYDIVTKSSLLTSDLVTELAKPSGNQVENDIDTESTLLDFDTVKKSMADLLEAIAQAKSILKAKKSARESLARLLSTLYLAQVSPDDLK